LFYRRESYYIDVKIISRAKGRSAVASAAYRRAAKFFDEQALRTWNYSNKSGVVHSEMTVPADAPHWAIHVNAEYLWNLVEKSENRKDAQLAREVEFALPVELTLAQSITLAREYIADQFVSLGMIADWNVHCDNEANPHVHVMLTTRELTQTGFGPKVRAWNDKKLLLQWRERWAHYANFHLTLHRHNVKIDHRSYKDQGIDLIPTVHRGRATDEMGKRHLQTDIQTESTQIKQANLNRIIEHPEIITQKIFQSIEYHESVFSERDLAKALLTYINSNDEFQQVMTQIKKSPELIYLGRGEAAVHCEAPPATFDDT